MLKKPTKANLAVLFLLLLSKTQAFGLGSGAFSNESGISAKANSHGYSFTGVADDASAIHYNPAGLVQVKGMSLMMGLAAIDIQTEHKSITGTKDKMDRNLPIAPYLYTSWSGTESRWAVGLGLNSPYGLITDWKDDSFSKYYATKSQIFMYSINPTVAYSISESFSVGAGLDYFNVYKTELRKRIPNTLVGGSTDGSAKLEGDGTAWGYNFGLHWKANERHSFGLSYRSQVNVPIEGTVEANDLQGLFALAAGAGSLKSDARTELKFPQTVTFGYGFRPSTNWTIFADYEWANWNINEETKFEYAQNSALYDQSIRRDWKNTNNVGVGAEWNLTDRTDLRFGALVYERVIPTYTLESSLPDAARWALTFGPGFHFGAFNLDLGYRLVVFDERSINNNQGNAFSNLDGKYDTTAHIFSAGIGYQWGANQVKR